MKFTKFDVTKKVINDIVMEYKEAKEAKDNKKMKKLQNQFQSVRKLLWSSYNYAKHNIDASKLYSEIQDGTIDNHKKEQNEILLGQRTLYLSNKQYVNNVALSDDIEEYIKKDNSKTLNFVKKHWTKFALSAAAATVVLALGLSGCSKSKEQGNTNGNGGTSTTQSNNAKEKEENVIEEVNNINSQENNDVQFDTNGFIKLNVLPEFDDKNGIINDINNEQKSNSANESTKNSENNGVNIKYNNDSFKKQEIVESLDPHVSNTDSGKKTTTIVKKETTVKEKDAIDYQKKVIDTTGVSDKEKVTIETKEETKKVNTKNIPIEGVKEEKPVDYKPTIQDDLIPTEEKVTIIEVDETKEVNTDIKPEENTIVQQEAEHEEVIIYEETEEKLEVNTENLPIEGLAMPKALVYRM